MSAMNFATGMFFSARRLVWTRVMKWPIDQFSLSSPANGVTPFSFSVFTTRSSSL